MAFFSTSREYTFYTVKACAHNLKHTTRKAFNYFVKYDRDDWAKNSYNDAEH